MDLAALIAALYVSVVWSAYFYLNITHSKSVNGMFLIAVFIGSYKLMHIIIKKIKRCELIPLATTKKKKWLVFMITAFLTIGVMLIWIFAYYPGSFSSDSIDQYRQALEENYNDWHPAWHTIIFFTLPLKIFGKAAAIIILQNIYFSLLMGYLALTIYEIGDLKATFLSISFILLNPYVGHIMLYPWKDVAFALGALFCTVFAIRLVVMEENTKRTWKLIAFGVALASTTIFRHNAILYTLPLLIAISLKTDKKTWLKVTIVTLISFFIIKVPIYNGLNVTKPGKRVLESTGLPLTVIANVVKETPDKLDEELTEFAYTLAAPELWEEKYSCGNFNSIKWEGINTSLVDKEGYWGMFKLMLKCFQLSPGASLDAFISLTDVVYGFENGLEGNVTTEISGNDYGISYVDNPGKLVEMCREVVNNYSTFIDGTVFRYFRTYGVCLAVVIVTFLGKLDFKSWNSWKRTFMLIPLLAYDFGTMLLLTGPDSRFFFITFWVTPLLIVYALSKGENKNDT